MKKPRVLSVVGWLLVAAVAAFFLFRYADARKYEDWLETQALDVVAQVQAIPTEKLEYIALYVPWGYRQQNSRAIAAPEQEERLGDWEYIIQSPDETLNAAAKKLIETMELTSFESRETPPTTGEERLEIIFFNGEDNCFTFHPRANIRLEYRLCMEDGNLLYAQYAVDRKALLTFWDALGVPRVISNRIE